MKAASADNRQNLTASFDASHHRSRCCSNDHVSILPYMRGDSFVFSQNGRFLRFQSTPPHEGRRLKDNIKPPLGFQASLR